MKVISGLVAAVLAVMTSAASGAELKVLSGHRVAVMTGTVVGDDWIKFVSLPETVRLIVLNSPGGDADAGATVMRTISQLKLATYVPPGGWCASSCAIIYAGGAKRYAAASARFLLHSAIEEDQPNNIRPQDESSELRWFNRTIPLWLAERGVDRTFAENAFKQPRSRYERELTAMQAQQIGLVHEIETLSMSVPTSRKGK